MDSSTLVEPKKSLQNALHRRQFYPGFSAKELKMLSAKRPGIILAIMQEEPVLARNQLKKRGVELLKPEKFFDVNVWTFVEIYPELRDLLNKNGATILFHSDHQEVRQLAGELYDEPEAKEIGDW